MKPPATTNPIVIIVEDVAVIAVLGPIYLGMELVRSLFRHKAKLILFALITIGIQGCAPELAATRSRRLGCGEACARAADQRGRRATLSRVDGEDCICGFDDGSATLTCRRPAFDGSCS